MCFCHLKTHQYAQNYDKSPGYNKTQQGFKRSFRNLLFHFILLQKLFQHFINLFLVFVTFQKQQCLLPNEKETI